MVNASDASSVQLEGNGNYLGGGTFDEATVSAGPNGLQTLSIGALTMQGVGNYAETNALKSATVSGDSNSATYTGSAPTATITGNGNYVNAR